MLGNWKTIEQVNGRWRLKCKTCGVFVLTRKTAEHLHHACPQGPETRADQRAEPLPCIHLGQPTGRTIRCELCGDRERLEPVHACPLHTECTVRATKGGTKDRPQVCLKCRDYEPDDAETSADASMLNA